MADPGRSPDQVPTARERRLPRKVALAGLGMAIVYVLLLLIGLGV